jgi:hypothetical protein
LVEHGVESVLMDFGTVFVAVLTSSP